MIEGTTGRIANHEVWKAIEACHRGGILSSTDLEDLACHFAAAAFCLEHRASGSATLPAEHVEWDGSDYVKPATIPPRPAPPHVPGFQQAPTVPGRPFHGRTLEEFLWEVELIAVQEQSKYDWEREFLGDYRSAPAVGRENFLLTLVKSIGRMRGFCTVPENLWNQDKSNGGERPFPAAPHEVTLVTGGRVRITR